MEYEVKWLGEVIDIVYAENADEAFKRATEQLEVRLIE